MSGKLTLGFWGIVDLTLRWIGKGVSWFLIKKSERGKENAAYAIIGGALVCAVIGGVIGYALSDLSRDIATLGGTVLGGMLGACAGIFFGSLVEAVDDEINDLLRSLSSK